MSDDPGRIEAVGRKMDRYLPGLFWLNFFGAALTVLIGKHVLTSMPGHRIEDTGAGVLLELVKHPTDWDQPESIITEEAVRDHVGSDLFYSKAHPDCEGRGLDWGLSA